MLVRPSVTPKDREDLLAGYSKRQERQEEIPADHPRSTVRFHPDVRHHHAADYTGDKDEDEEEIDKEEEEEDFPIRKKPVKGRKQTAFSFSSKQSSSSDIVPSVSQAPKHIPAMNAVDFDDESQDETMTNNASSTPSKANKGISMGMASRIAGAFKMKNKRSTVFSGAQHNEDHSSLSDHSITENVEVTNGNIDKSIVNTTCMTDAFSPVFAEGISLFQPTATYNAKDNKALNKNLKNLSGGKHGFARIVEAARHHSKGASVVTNTTNNHQKNANTVHGIAPGPRARLLELAKSAKTKAAQQKQKGGGGGGSGSETGDASRSSSRDEEPGWKCAGLDHSTLLSDSTPLPSLTVEPATPHRSSDRDHRKESRKTAVPQIDQKGHPTIRKSASRHRLADCEQAGSSAEIVWISRDGKEAPPPTSEDRSHHHSNGRHHRSERSHSRHRPHHRDTEESHSHSAEDLRRQHGNEQRPTKVEMATHRSGHSQERERQHERSHRSRHPEHDHPSSSPSPSPHHHHHHHNHSHHHRSHAAAATTTTTVKPSEQLPDKRRGKVLDQGAETQRLNLALTMARTRMEMEIAEQQDAPKNGANGIVAGEAVEAGHFVKDDEEKAWLDEAYEEAVKREVEYQYLYDAHALGSSW